MGREAWTVRLGDRDHRIEVDHGYWSQKVEIRIDGEVVHQSRPIVAMSNDRGVDVPIRIDDHPGVVVIRPIFTKRGMWVSGYRYALTVDGHPAGGSNELPPLVPSRRRPVPTVTEFV